MKRIYAFLFTALVLQAGAWGQLPSPIAIQFKKHISTLASDEYEGRETGTEGERKAREYIKAEFSKLGLSPAGDAGDWFQAFEFSHGRKYEAGNALLIGKEARELSKTWFPLPLGANGMVTAKVADVGFGISAPDLGHDDYADKKKLSGKIFLIRLSSPDGLHPHSKFIDHNDLRTRVSVAQKHGAAAVIIINEDPDAESPVENLMSREVRENIPVVFLTQWDYKKLIKSTVSLTVNTSEVKRTGRNVCGYIDNGAARTIVLGAHYDHLGWGDAHSLHRGEPAIHNGADDNASGVAMIIELARYLKAAGSRNFNYLFLAFSGEELGLYGSKYFVDHPFGKLENVNYMLNFDMVGRLDNEGYKVGINGTGTSPQWSVLDSIHIGRLSIKKSASGVGPSDQTSFYLKDVPVLHFFSGTHGDYHKPGDDEEKINYAGMEDIYAYVLELMKRLEGNQAIAFTQTKNEDNSDAPRFTVTLGVVPDYMYDGTGMRIDGVTEGKPAASAGLVKGDIVIQLGNHEVKDMMSYMKALSKFKKGDKTTVTFKRGEEQKQAEIAF